MENNEMPEWGKMVIKKLVEMNLEALASNETPPPTDPEPEHPFGKAEANEVSPAVREYLKTQK